MEARTTPEKKRVAPVVDRQDQARDLEARGDVVGALAIYDDLLRQFEHDPTSLTGAPHLYVRVGDLRARLGQSHRAFAAYHQAAEHFALRGEAGQISKLCFRMTHLSPAAADVYGRYARRLNDYGYADSALGILKEYATTAGLKTVADAVHAAEAQVRSGSPPQMKALLDSFENELQRADSGSHTHTPDEATRSVPSRPSREEMPALRNDLERNRGRRWMYAVSVAAVVAIGLAAMVFGRRTEPVPVYTLAAINPRPPAFVSPLPEEDSIPATSKAPQGSRPATNTTARIITEPVVAGDLAIRRITEVEYRGQRGFRVVHVLASGSEFTVESYPVDAETSRRYPIGSVRVNKVLPDTTVSIVRVDERHLAFTSGVLSEDSARVLTCMLRVRQPSEQNASPRD